jgi:hypothetical protein
MFCVLLMNLLKLGFNHIIIVDRIYLTICKLERFVVLSKLIFRILLFNHHVAVQRWADLC